MLDIYSSKIVFETLNFN